MTDWRAVLLNLLVRNPHQINWDLPSGEHYEPFMEVLREAEAEIEARYQAGRVEMLKMREDQFRTLVTKMKPVWDKTRAKFGRDPVDVETEVAKMMRE